MRVSVIFKHFLIAFLYSISVYWIILSLAIITIAFSAKEKEEGRGKKILPIFQVIKFPVSITLFYSDLDSADFQNSKFIAKLSTDVATSALLYKIVIEVNYRWRSFEVNQSAIDVNAIF